LECSDSSAATLLSHRWSDFGRPSPLSLDLSIIGRTGQVPSSFDIASCPSYTSRRLRRRGDANTRDLHLRHTWTSAYHVFGGLCQGQSSSRIKYKSNISTSTSSERLSIVTRTTLERSVFVLGSAQRAYGNLGPDQTLPGGAQNDRPSRDLQMRINRSRRAGVQGKNDWTKRVTQSGNGGT